MVGMTKQQRYSKTSKGKAARRRHYQKHREKILLRLRNQRQRKKLNQAELTKTKRKRIKKTTWIYFESPIRLFFD